MEKQEFKYVNEIVLRGPIVRKFANNIACNFTIKTPRLNLPNVTSDEVAYNYPEIAFYGELRELAAENYAEGDVVEIVGMVQPQKKISKDTGRDYYEQKLIGISIKRSERLLMREFGYDEGTFVESENLVKLGGVVSKIATPHSGVITINIRTFINDRIYNIQTFMYERNIGKYMENIHVGDKVFAVGTIQTLKKKIKEGPDKYFKNIVLAAICKTDV